MGSPNRQTISQTIFGNFSLNAKEVRPEEWLNLLIGLRTKVNPYLKYLCNSTIISSAVHAYDSTTEQAVMAKLVYGDTLSERTKGIFLHLLRPRRAREGATRSNLIFLTENGTWVVWKSLIVHAGGVRFRHVVQSSELQTIDESGLRRLLKESRCPPNQYFDTALLCILHRTENYSRELEERSKKMRTLNDDLKSVRTRAGLPARL
jgi:hypothetical protein